MKKFYFYITAELGVVVLSFIKISENLKHQGPKLRIFFYPYASKIFNFLKNISLINDDISLF